jgi:hypothetical protein
MDGQKDVLGLGLGMLYLYERGTVSIAVGNILGKRSGRLGIYILKNSKLVKMRGISERISVLVWLIFT